MVTREVHLPGSRESTFDLPRPRIVRVKMVPQIMLVALPLVAAFLFYSDAQVISSPHRIGSHLPQFQGAYLEFIFPSLMIIVSSVTLWMVRRDLMLLKNGGLAMAVVIHQEMTGRRRSQSTIWYRFRTTSGETYQGTGTDYSRKVRVDMTVPVFYKPENPTVNVALCAATCELRVD
jgi:hypothetical protein